MSRPGFGVARPCSDIEDAYCKLLKTRSLARPPGVEVTFSM